MKNGKKEEESKRKQGEKMISLSFFLSASLFLLPNALFLVDVRDVRLVRLLDDYLRKRESRFGFWIWW